MKLIEFFAGSRSVSQQAETLGFETFSVDFKPFPKIDLVADIEFVKASDFGFIPDVVWFSPPCQSYSVAAFQYHRYGIEPKSDFAEKSDRLLNAVARLIKEFQALNPNFIFFIENPMGMMRKMPVMQQFKRTLVTYCSYGDFRMKPTDIWTNNLYSQFNVTGWKPRQPCKNNNKDCHHERSPRLAKNAGTQKLKNDYERSKIPAQLCAEILQSCFETIKKFEEPGNDWLQTGQTEPGVKNRPFKTYNGGKNGSGVYQAIINQIPPHDTFISMFGGNCGVLANKARAKKNIIIDLSAKVIDGWNRLPGVTAIKADASGYLSHLKKTSDNGVFLFADPPYLKETRSCQGNLYDFEMADPVAHEKLLRELMQYKCNVLITHYPCKLYNDLLKTWRKVDIKGRTRNGMRTERLYMNYPAPVALHDYQYIGDDYRAREEYKKMANNMVAKFQRMSELERNFCLQHLQNTGYVPAFFTQQFDSINKPKSRYKEQQLFTNDITTVKKPVQSAGSTGNKPVMARNTKKAGNIPPHILPVSAATI